MVQPRTDGDIETARARIRGALNPGGFTVHFQPVVDIRIGSTVGAEALARFSGEPRRSPDVWFNEAWEVGLGIELELVAIERALQQISALPEETYVAVNAAPETLRSAALLEMIARFIPKRVVVELTEHARVDDYRPLLEAIARLRALGVRLSVDDAGAGFASFQHVMLLRPDIIKLDRGLTTQVDRNPVRAALAGAIVTFSNSLGSNICAEGVETVEELATLQKLGVKYGQGYLLARPAPLPLPACRRVCGRSR